MRVPLEEFSPKWLARGPGRERMGISLQCPACGDHRLECWLLRPLDHQGAITGTPERPVMEAIGHTFDNLTLRDYLECGPDYIVIIKGNVLVG